MAFVYGLQRSPGNVYQLHYIYIVCARSLEKVWMNSGDKIDKY